MDIYSLWILHDFWIFMDMSWISNSLWIIYEKTRWFTQCFVDEIAYPANILFVWNDISFSPRMTQVNYASTRTMSTWQ